MINKLKELIFMGTGSSSSVPNIYCALSSTPDCNVCISARSNSSPNRRRNTSALIVTETENILIDCGKTFHESCSYVFPNLQISKIDRVLISHSHADAMNGLDDLRSLKGKKVPVHVSKHTFDTINSSFPYLVDSGKATGAGDVSDLDFKVFAENEPIIVAGMEIVPFPVEHGFYSDGRPFISYGFRFGSVCYISDVSKIPTASEKYLENADILVIDCLKESGKYPSHFCLDQVAETVKQFRPGSCYLVGMGHKVDYHEILATCFKKFPELNIKPAYDGLSLKFE